MQRIGMRLWLAAAFAAVSVITAGVVYLAGDRPRAVLGAIGLGVLAGFLIAAAIAKRVERLADAAAKMASGSFDVPLESGGPAEIRDPPPAPGAAPASLHANLGRP